MKMDATAFVADQELVVELKKHATRIDCAQDCVLFRQGGAPEGLYIFCGGQVWLTLKSSAGDEVMSLSVEAGSLLGLPAVIGNVPYSLSARARKGSLVSFIQREDFSRLMLTHPSISVGVLRVLAAEVRTARAALVEI